MQLPFGAELRPEDLFSFSLGTSAFIFSLQLSQAFQYYLRISSSTPFLAKSFGFLAVSYGSILADYFALSRKGSSSFANGSKAKYLREKKMIRLVASTMTGLLIFRGLGGKLISTSPSSLSNLGAFHRMRASLPASLSYATGAERTKIQQFGTRYGCHTCGTLRAKFIADHMPPIKIAKEINSRLWRRLTGLKIHQRFYPQCEPCSKLQAQAVRAGRTELVSHFLQLRKYHLTGLFVCLAGPAVDRAVDAGEASGILGMLIRTHK